MTFANGDTFVPPASDIAPRRSLHGAVFIVGGTLIFNTASRSIPAAQMTVFAQTEMVLVPVWAFLLLSERPTRRARCSAASLIVIAVVGMALLDVRDQARAEVLTAV